METKKITEGGMLAALQIVLGLILIPTGIGYVFCVEIVFAITSVLIYIRCGTQLGFWVNVNTFLMIALLTGNIVFGIYLLQALGFGLLTVLCIEKDRSIQDDLLVECLLGCIFMLALDFLTANMVGKSLLDDETSEMILELIPNANIAVVQIVYYLSIAAMPVGFALSTYIGSLVLGYRLGVLSKEERRKYDLMRYYKWLVPYMYHHPKNVRCGILGLLVNLFLWPYAKHAYLKAWIVSSSAILLYFLMIDLVKLIGQALIEKWKKPSLFMIYQLGIWIGLIKEFKWTCGAIILIGSFIDLKTDIRMRETQRLALHIRRLKNAPIK